MNQHPCKQPELVNKSIFDQAVRRVKCPACGSDPGFFCERLPPAKSAGAKCWPPHIKRVRDLYVATPGGVREFSLSAERIPNG